MDYAKTHSSLKILLEDLYIFMDCIVNEKAIVSDIVGQFKRSPSLPGVIVAVNGDILGVISRERCFECLGRPYGVDLFMKTPAMVFFQHAGIKPLIVPANTRLEDALQLALSRDAQAVFDPIVIRDKNTFGIMTMHSMLTAQIDLMMKLFEEVQLLSIKDPLTNINNRRGFFNLAQNGVEQARFLGQDMGVLMIDIDNFKKTNDAYGHAIGDQVIKAVADMCQNHIRKADLLGRYGGEEFILLLPESNIETTWTIAERIRKNIAQMIVSVDRYHISVTVSIGISCVHTAKESLEDLLKQADQALYYAKGTGRNRTVIWNAALKENQSNEIVEPYHAMNTTTLQSSPSGLIDLHQLYNETIETWVRALELRDEDTEGHSHRVTVLTLALAEEYGIRDAAELEYIRWGALLHDIGKIAIPDKILLKPGKLTEEEWVTMRKHPVFAYDLLSPIAYLRPALDIPYCHHEHWDGKGYPRGLKGEEIPLTARIFTIVDVWDALNSERRYRPAWPVERIRSYMLDESGKLFDPAVVEHFLRLLDEGMVLSNHIPVETGTLFNPGHKEMSVN